MSEDYGTGLQGVGTELPNGDIVFVRLAGPQSFHLHWNSKDKENKADVVVSSEEMAAIVRSVPREPEWLDNRTTYLPDFDVLRPTKLGSSHELHDNAVIQFPTKG